MANVIQMRRGVAETLTSAQSVTSTGVGQNEVRLPTEYLGARIAWQTVTSGITGTPTFALQASLDGVNWFTFDSSTAVAGEARIVIVEGIAALRLNITAAGTAGTVTALIRAA